MMPMDKKRYPDNWDEIAKEYKDSIGWKCENCKTGHMEDGTMKSCLTVHHVNHDPENPEFEKIGLCAKCHLKFEAHYKKYGDLKNQLKLFRKGD